MHIDFTKPTIDLINSSLSKNNGVINNKEVPFLISLLKRRSKKLRNYTPEDILHELDNQKIIRYIVFKKTGFAIKNDSKLIFSVDDDLNEYYICQRFLPKFFFSFYSAMYIHDLTINVPKVINMRTHIKKPINEEIEINQKLMDKVFTKDHRITNKSFEFKLENRLHISRVTEGYKTTTSSIEKKEFLGHFVNVSTLEQTLIDITIHPRYSGGIDEVLQAYSRSKERICMPKLVNLYNSHFFKYPYYKRILFYMKLSGYSSESISEFSESVHKNNLDKLKFYLDTQIIKPSLDSELSMYYPSHLNEYITKVIKLEGINES